MSNNGILFYEKNIVDIKYEYTNYLTNILIPPIFDGLNGLAEKAIIFDKQRIEKMKQNPNVQNLGVVKIFQSLLENFESLSRHNIELETIRIKEKSGCSEWFDDLIKAVIKSYIVLLTYNASGKKCKLVEEKFHEKVDIIDFIHKCYIECAKVFINTPELFFSNDKHSKLNIYTIINNCILNAIRIIIPIKLILKEYLKNDYIQDDREEKYDQLREKIRQDLEKKEQFAGYMKKPLLESDSDEQPVIEQPIVKKPIIEQPIEKPEISKPIIKQKEENTLGKGASDHAIRNVLDGKKRIMVKMEPLKKSTKEPGKDLTRIDEKDEIKISDEKEISSEEFIKKVS